MGTEKSIDPYLLFDDKGDLRQPTEPVRDQQESESPEALTKLFFATPQPKRIIGFFSHASALDPFVIFAALGPNVCLSWVYKKSLLYFPGFFFLAWGTKQASGAVDRSNRQGAIAVMDQLAMGPLPVLVSPEGTRSTTGQILAELKKGMFHLRQRLRAKVVIITVAGAYELWGRGVQILFPRFGRVVVSFLPGMDVPRDFERDNEVVIGDNQGFDAVSRRESYGKGKCNTTPRQTVNDFATGPSDDKSTLNEVNALVKTSAESRLLVVAQNDCSNDRTTGHKSPTKGVSVCVDSQENKRCAEVSATAGCSRRRLTAEERVALDKISLEETRTRVRRAMVSSLARPELVTVLDAPLSTGFCLRCIFFYCPFWFLNYGIFIYSLISLRDVLNRLKEP